MPTTSKAARQASAATQQKRTLEVRCLRDLEPRFFGAFSEESPILRPNQSAVPFRAPVSYQLRALFLEGGPLRFGLGLQAELSVNHGSNHVVKRVLRRGRQPDQAACNVILALHVGRER